jgi:sulfite exporter TauE/SafE
MLAFGIGAALPLLGLGWLSRETMARWRGRLLAAGAGMKSALGLFLLVIGLLIISGADKTFETFLVDVSPEWLANLTTRF